MVKWLSDYRRYRLLEIIPGALVWSTFVAAIVVTFVSPITAIYFIIIFDLYWLVRVVYMIAYMMVSWRRNRRARGEDWQRRLVAEFPQWREYRHLIFVPTYQEGYEVLRDTIASFTTSALPTSQCVVILAGEARDRHTFEPIAARLRQEFGGSFYEFLVTIHPADIPGEVAGKGANIAYAGRQARAFVDRQGWDYGRVIVSSFDADTCIHPQYFSYLTHTYLSHPNPTRASYQPLAVFNNNVWQAPAPTRVIAFSTTFWLMTEQPRHERMFTFSSHSMSLKALVDVGFWQNDIVTEDSRICLQCMMEYDGDYEVVPLYLPLSMDVVLGNTFWDSLKAQYVQQRRWAYGVENFPYMVWNFGRNKSMPFIKKFRYIFNQFEGVYSWATAPILIFILGHLPIWYANQRGYTDVISQNAPHVLQWLMTAAMVGMVVQAILSTTLLPPLPKHYSRLRLLPMVLQWVLVPVTMILFGSIPATDAQTRLMLGKYLGFQVTKKVRKKDVSSAAPTTPTTAAS